MSAKITAFMRQIEEGKIESNRAKIFVAIQRWSSISTKTLIDNYGLHPTVTSVLSSLESDGLIRKSGEIEIDGRVFSQWVAHSSVDGIMAHKREIEEKKKAQWIKRAQNAGWIDNQVAFFLTNYLANGKQ